MAETDLLIVREQKILIMLPDFSEKEHPAIVNWFRHLEEDIYEAGLSFVGQYPYDEGCSIWAVQVDEKTKKIELLMNLLQDWGGKKETDANMEGELC